MNTSSLKGFKAFLFAKEFFRTRSREDKQSQTQLPEFSQAHHNQIDQKLKQTYHLERRYFL